MDIDQYLGLLTKEEIETIKEELKDSKENPDNHEEFYKSTVLKLVITGEEAFSKYDEQHDLSAAKYNALMHSVMVGFFNIYMEHVLSNLEEEKRKEFIKFTIKEIMESTVPN